jgi:sulfonate transport system permease protein
MNYSKNMTFGKGLIIPLFVLILWWFGSRAGWWNLFLLPSPAQVVSAFGISVQNGDLQANVYASLSRIVCGFGLSAIIALTTALLCAWFPKLLDFISPSLEFMRHVPPMSVIPMLILWFGIGESPKIILIILATFFPVYMNALSGITGCDPKLIEVGEIFKYSKWQIFKFIILPDAVPSILTGLRLGLGYSWRSLIAAELVAASSGIGYMILDAEQLSRSDVVMMGIFVIGALGALMDFGFLWIMKRSLKGRAVL